jgi:DNA-binding Lrp family transcriptional regulator
MSLKPQDVVVALKILTYSGRRPPISAIAGELSMSPSEVHGAIKRLQQARLLHGPESGEKPNVAALEEFLVHGVKYAFPSQHGEVTRGIPTSYAAAPLNSMIFPGEELPPVWPAPEGDTRGIALQPLYKSAPAAAVRDPLLYELLALLDGIRDGRARERKIAEKELIKRLGAHHASA